MRISWGGLLEEVVFSLITRSLQVLLCPLPYPIQRLFQILDGIGNAETQIPFAEPAKSCPGQTRDSRFLEKSICQLLRIHTGLADVGKDIKSACRDLGAETLDLVDALHKTVTAAL